MSISIKSKKDIEKMKIAGQKATSVLEMLKDHVVPGVSTAELDSLAFKFITEELYLLICLQTLSSSFDPTNIGFIFFSSNFLIISLKKKIGILLYFLFFEPPGIRIA